jgi:hypothetical protein
MRRSLLLSLGLALGAPAAAHAQYWVEFSPGTCQVGPPPACVAGHWHPLQLPQAPVRSPIQSAAALGGGDADGEQQQKATDISTDLEYEHFSFRDVMSGTAIGLRGMYLRQNMDGRGYGAVVTAERSILHDFEGEASSILGAHMFMSADLGGRFLSEDARLDQVLTGQAGLSLSSFRPGGMDDALNTFGPFGTVQYTRFLGLMSYGASLTYSMARRGGTDFGVDAATAGSWALGFNGGYMLNDATFVSGDLYSLKGGLMVLGGTMTRAFSPTFGLTLGAKTLMGQDDFSSFRMTLGSTYRAR